MFKSSRIKGLRYHKTEGSVFVEAMIAIPLFLLVIFFLIYFSLVFITRGLIDDTAQKALSLAVTHPGFEVQPAGYETQEDCLDAEASGDSFCQALTEVLELAKQIPSNGIISDTIGAGQIAYLTEEPRINIPVPGELYPTTDEVYSQIPFEIVIQAKVSSIIPGLEIPVSAKALGYYETHYSPSIPAEIDCHGYTYLHPKYKTEPCDCSAEPNAVFDLDTYQCHTCQYDQSSVADPPAHYSGTNSVGCNCPSTQLCEQLYGVGSRAHGCRCRCVSGWGFVGGYESTCSCGPAPAGYTHPSGVVEFQAERQVGDSGQCECTKTDGSKLTTAECKSFFPEIASQVQVHPNKCKCRCIPGDRDHCEGTGGTVGWNTDPAVAGGCPCNICGAGKEYDPDSETCVCSGGAQDCGPFGEWDESSCSCNCFGDCNGWDVLDPETCQCDCEGDGWSCDEPYGGPSGPG